MSCVRIDIKEQRYGRLTVIEPAKGKRMATKTFAPVDHHGRVEELVDE